MKRIKFLGHQGDVGLWEVDELPTDVKELKTDIVMYGEVTGHRHRLQGNSRIFGKIQPEYLLIEEDSELIHEEHKPVLLGKGKIIQIVRERETIPFQNEIRQVTD